MRILVIAFLTLLAAAAPAQAQFSLVNPSAKPADTAAGANSDVTIHVETQGGDIKDLVLHLPPGLVGNPNATARCPLATFRAGGQCPADTQVGQATNKLTLDLLGAQTTAGGPIFNVQPEGSEPARLGIRVDSPIPGNAPILLESPAGIRTSDQGLDSTLKNIPNTFSGMDITINALDVVLFGRAGARKNGKGFINNPTSCAAAETSFEAISYAGEKATTKAAFTPTKCDALPFDPQFTATISGEVAQGKHPVVSTNVGQSPGEANTRKVEVVLPTDFGVSLSVAACPVEVFTQGACPPGATVGQATAVTPLLTTPLEGPVQFVAGSTTLPDLILQLKGQLPLTVRGVNSFAPGGGQATTFDGLPDVPLSKFELRFNGGDGGLLTAAKDLCKAPPQFRATFTSQAGKEVRKTVAGVVEGCAPAAAAPPKATLRLKGRSLRLSVKGNGTRLRKVRLALPKGVTLSRKARGSISGGNAKGAKLKLRGRTIDLTVPGTGARTLGLALRTGAVKNVKALRRKAATVTITSADGKKRTVRLKA